MRLFLMRIRRAIRNLINTKEVEDVDQETLDQWEEFHKEDMKKRGWNLRGTL